MQKSPTTARKLTAVQKQHLFWGYLMAAPTVIGLIVLNIIPFFYTIYLSLTDTIGIGKYEFAGLVNYEKLLSGSDIYSSIANSAIYSFLVVPVGIFLSLIIAVLINSKIRGATIYRTIYFLPMVAAPAAVAVVWRWLFNGDFGLINYCLNAIGLSSVSWLTSPTTAMLSVSIVGIWSNLGYNMVILLAGLRDIPAMYYEAADIDGASPVRKFFQITLPLVSPSIFFLSITRLINALGEFDLVYMMIDEFNPAKNSMRTIMYYYYQQAFDYNNKSFASAIVVILFLIIMLITAIQFIAQKKWVHYE